MKSMTVSEAIGLVLATGAAALVAGCATVQGAPAHGTPTVHGYVLDSACAFIKDLDKPISRDCAIRCAQAGSPLVILADDGTIYWPISSAMPAVGQNERLLEFAGERVTASGTNYARGGSCGFVIEKIEHESPTKP